MIGWLSVLARLALIVACLAVASARVADAHNRSESYSNWNLRDGGAVAVITVSTGEVAALLSATDPKPLATAFGEHALNSVRVFGEGPCETRGWQELRAARGFLRIELEFDCESEVTEIEYRALFDAQPSHVHYLTIAVRGESPGEAIVTDRADRWQRAETPRSQSFAAFFALGWSHILGGVDHIAFLAGLLLVAGGVGRSILSVTGFTVGHSLSLAAAVTGVVSVDARLVEAFIGFTVALVACEYIARRGKAAGTIGLAALLAALVTGALALASGTVDGRGSAMYLGFGAFAACYLPLTGWSGTRVTELKARGLFALTAAFGIVHGFGFAGFLMDTGLEGRSLALPLLGFNLGVEIGQLALVAAALAGAALLRKRWIDRAAPIVAASLCGVGLYWFIDRSLGV